MIARIPFQRDAVIGLQKRVLLTNAVTDCRHEGILCPFFPVAETQVHSLCLNRICFHIVYPARKPHRGRGRRDTGKSIRPGRGPEREQTCQGVPTDTELYIRANPLAQLLQQAVKDEGKCLLCHSAKGYFSEYRRCLPGA